MKLILTKTVKFLGTEGETINAKDGYARNYLIPKKLAVPYTAGAVKALEVKRKKALAQAEKEKEKCQLLAKKIAQLSLNIPMESGVNDALFGSVTSDLVSRAFQQEGIEIDKKDITIAEPIKKLGIYSAEVKLHPEIKENVRIWVVKK